MTSNSHFYEKAIRDIYDAIAQEQSVRTLNTQYPATIQGKTSVHAADIYWEFTDGDIIYKTVIQAKETVTLGELFSLVRIIRDIPGQTTGVLITQPVYKKDIKEMAANAGIILYELLEPSGQDLWEPVVDNIQINVDKEWVKKEKERVGLGDEQVQISANPKYSFIYDENGNLVDSVQGIFDSYSRKHRSAGTERRTVIHEFPAPAFLQTHHELVPFIKLENITFDFALVNVNELSGEEMVKYILGNIFKYFGQ